MPHSLKSLIEFIMNNYDTSATFKNNVVADQIRHGINNIPDTQNISSSRFKFKGSPGQGAWAEVPWIGLFDTVTFKRSAKQGIYLVYLLSTDQKRIYLSLNQGWTSFKDIYGKKEAYKKVELIAKSLRHVIPEDLLTNISNTNYKINLGSNKENPKGYSASNIISIEYDRDNLPSNSQMIKDLLVMKQILTEVIDNVKVSYGKHVIHSKKSGDNSLTFNNEHATHYIEPELPPHNDKQKDITYNESYQKQDYEQIQKIKKFWGDNGEAWVKRNEQLKLRECGRNDLAEKVEHVSVTKGDGLGFDIVSFDENGNKIFIEVKTTTGKDKDFQISANELKASEYYGDNYYIYRVFNFNNDNKDPQYYILNGNMFNKLNLKATYYRANPK